MLTKQLRKDLDSAMSEFAEVLQIHQEGHCAQYSIETGWQFPCDLLNIAFPMPIEQEKFKRCLKRG